MVPQEGKHEIPKLPSFLPSLLALAPPFSLCEMGRAESRRVTGRPPGLAGINAAFRHFFSRDGAYSSSLRPFSLLGSALLSSPAALPKAAINAENGL